MIDSFADQASGDLYRGVNSAAARRRLPRELWARAQRKLDQLRFAPTLEEMNHPPGNRLEKLRGDREGQYSIRINGQYRICFAWTGKAFSSVEVTDYH